MSKFGSALLPVDSSFHAIRVTEEWLAENPLIPGGYYVEQAGQPVSFMTAAEFEASFSSLECKPQNSAPSKIELIAERASVSVYLKALGAQFNEGAYRDLHGPALERVRSQSSCMWGYLHILDERIAEMKE